MFIERGTRSAFNAVRQLFVVILEKEELSATIDQPFLAELAARGAYDHDDLLRTIEEIFHTGTLHHHDDVARVIDDVWKR